MLQQWQNTSSFSTVASFTRRMSSCTSKLKRGPEDKQMNNPVQDATMLRNYHTTAFPALTCSHQICLWLWSRWSRKNCDAERQKRLRSLRKYNSTRCIARLDSLMCSYMWDDQILLNVHELLHPCRPAEGRTCEPHSLQHPNTNRKEDTCQATHLNNEAE